MPADAWRRRGRLQFGARGACERGGRRRRRPAAGRRGCRGGVMRLKRLDLTRYGKFTDHSIDFAEREAGTPDLHIVYGPNEAGKSTALAAFLDLLYGIEPRSRFNFLHSYPVMRIGATLEFGGQVLELGRVKRAQNDLLDAGGLPVAEAAIAGQLGGIDRESY